MLDFGFFSDIRNNVILADDNNKRELFYNNFCMISEMRDDLDAIKMLIGECNMNMTERLMGYFDKKAPVQQLLRERLVQLKQNEKDGTIEEYIVSSKSKSVSFYQYLTGWIEKKGYQTEAEFYNYIGMSRQTFAKIRKKENQISRNYALLMAVGLELNYLEAVEFMGHAGYMFRQADTREAIICYVMRNKKYTLSSMEEILMGFGEKSLMEA